MRRQHTIEEKEARPPEVTSEQVTAYLATAQQPSTIRQIAHGMDLKHRGRRFLPRVIKQLKRRGDIEEIRGGRYRLAGQKNGPAPAVRRAVAPPSTKTPTSSPSSEIAAQPLKRARDPNLIAGRIVAHRDGYGFVVPDEPIPRVEGDLFIGRDSLGDAMNGDRVLARVERRRADGRAEGRIVQIVERAASHDRRPVSLRPAREFVLPYDTRITHEVFIPPGEELTPELREKLARFGADGPRQRERPCASSPNSMAPL